MKCICENCPDIKIKSISELLNHIKVNHNINLSRQEYDYFEHNNISGKSIWKWRIGNTTWKVEFS